MKAFFLLHRLVLDGVYRLKNSALENKGASLAITHQAFNYIHTERGYYVVQFFQRYGRRLTLVIRYVNTHIVVAKLGNKAVTE